MRITLVVATDLDGVIGRDNGLPWHLPADLEHFKSVTMGKPMIMGRRTWESIGRALPGRTSIVLTHDPDFTAPGARVAHAPEEALAIATAEAGSDGEVMVIGGATLFAAFLDRATSIHWTQVQARVGGDRYFPAPDPEVWVEVERRDRPADARNLFALVLRKLERRPDPDAPVPRLARPRS